MKELSLERVQKILNELQNKGLVYKTWDKEKDDYVWHQTKLGREYIKELKPDD